jgi:hypothetical protein
MASSDVAIDLNSNSQHGTEHAFLPTTNYRYSSASYSDNELPGQGYDSPKAGGLFVEPDSSLLWTKENTEDDDYLHVSVQACPMYRPAKYADN